MFVLFSQLRKYLPDLTETPEEVAKAFTLTGQMINTIESVNYQGEKDYLLDLEVRQNRVDCLGVIGLAKELSAYYDIPLALDTFMLNVSESLEELPIKIEATEWVKRVMAIKIKNITIKESPAWLKQYLELNEINSINLLVDLTNYVLLETGIPSHVFDSDLVGERLIWEINSEYKTITTLKGNELDLTQSSNTLIISNGEKPLSLSFIGGKEDAVNVNSQNIILEMGIYDEGLVRRNSRNFNTITESSQRLEKYLDPEMVPMAFAMLVNLIIENCEGEIDSKVYDNYLNPVERNEIKINIKKISQIAGIEIEIKDSLNILDRLGFEIVSQSEEELIVKRPINRLDINIQEDCIEEIIRIYGYTNIPKDNLSVEVTKNITPSHLVLIDHIQNILEFNGFDEVRSWVLVNEESNAKTNFEDWNPVKVTNSINEEVPFLRQSISASLFNQLHTYKKNNITYIKIFEIGKVFGQRGTHYDENYSLGLLLGNNDINLLKEYVEKIIRYFEIGNVIYSKSDKIIPSAHPKSIWNIEIQNFNNEFVKVGLMYLSNKEVENECVIAEININAFNDVILGVSKRSVFEINQKLIGLDANLFVQNNEDPNVVIIEKLNNIGNIWSWGIIDEYKESDRKKITVRVWYRDMSDQEAKLLHSEIFK